MKIPLVYPKIPDTFNCPLRQCIAFEKLDGTNIHFVYGEGEWRGFGTRRDWFPNGFEGERAFCQAHPELEAVLNNDVDFLIFLNEFLKETPKYNDAKKVILFMEWYGDNSFAGTHQTTDIPRLFLIDVQINGRMLPPEEFIEDFKGFENYIPRVIFKGKFTGQLFIDVRKGKYDVKEGVVVKGVVNGEVYMCKIKTDAYLEKLKSNFKDNWKEYWE